MQIFACPACQGTLFFENLACSCGQAVTFDVDTQSMMPAGAICANRSLIGCNWSADDGGWCRSCAMTVVRPDLDIAGNIDLWSDAELAKRWVLSALARWRWFTRQDGGPRPEFHMLAETTTNGQFDISMGHLSGVVTLNIAEADAATRVWRREQLGEHYRTMIGHIRHEMAHVLFERLAQSAEFITRFRALFGDERLDYGEAIARHHQMGPPPDWQSAHVTAYASSHPHEDWAESAAHVLHLTDIVDSFSASGLTGPDLPAAGYDAYLETDAEGLIASGMRLGVALNHVNRAMGLSDIYPFVNNQRVREKLGFAHDWLTTGASM